MEKSVISYTQFVESSKSMTEDAFDRTKRVEENLGEMPMKGVYNVFSMPDEIFRFYKDSLISVKMAIIQGMLVI